MHVFHQIWSSIVVKIILKRETVRENIKSDDRRMKLLNSVVDLLLIVNALALLHPSCQKSEEKIMVLSNRIF